MTERDDNNDHRWTIALDGIKELGVAQLELRKMVQRGFETIGEGLNQQRRRTEVLESDMKALRLAESDCQQRLARVEADGTARGEQARITLVLLTTCGMALLVLLFIAWRIAAFFGVL
jgi:ABC-type hemin transport system substrate-binding protein